MIRLASNPDIKSSDGILLIDTSVTGSSHFFGSMDCALRVLLKAGLVQGNASKFGIDAQGNWKDDSFKLLAEATLETMAKVTVTYNFEAQGGRRPIKHEAQLNLVLGDRGHKELSFSVKPNDREEWKGEMKGVWTLEKSDFTAQLESPRRTLMEFEAKRESYTNMKYHLKIPSDRIDAAFESTINVRRSDDFDASAQLHLNSIEVRRWDDYDPRSPTSFFDLPMGIFAPNVELAFNARQRGKVNLDVKLDQGNGIKRALRYEHSNFGDLIEFAASAYDCDYLLFKRTAKDNGRQHILSLDCQNNNWNGNLEVFYQMGRDNLKFKMAESWTGGDFECNLNRSNRINKIDVTAKLTHPKISMTLNLDAQENREKLGVNGKFEVDFDGMKKTMSFQYDQVRPDQLELKVNVDGCDILKVKRTDKDNGKLHTLSINCEPFGTSAYDGDVEVFYAHSLWSSQGHLKLTVDETWTGRKMEINLDLAQKELKLDIARSGVKVHEVYAKATLNGDMNFLLRYKKNGSRVFKIECQFEQSIQGFIDIKMAPGAFEMRADISHDR